ncbi:cation:proton antiporter regulatory subunit [Halorubrum trueperi]|uniref:Cation:proton antiporter regulatory subunit n=1 Tax=Halorubrum trueperi TaxID=2004704 RepID=A0ABD5UIG3_9EURY
MTGAVAGATGAVAGATGAIAELAGASGVIAEPAVGAVGLLVVDGTAVEVGFARPRQAAVTLATFAILAAVVAGSAALTYRWYFRDEVPEGVTALLGVAVVALYLNTTSLGAVAGGDSPALLEPERVFFNVVSLGVAAVTAPVGRYVGDRLAVDVFALSGARQLEGELSGIVRAVGRFTAVTLPEAEDVKDMDTYDPVSPEKKAELAGKTLLFARKLSGEQLRERLVSRVKSDYGVGYVDVDVSEDGEVEYFAVGSRAAGLGPTLAPGSAAIAVAADPPNNATAGDAVQVWRAEPEAKRVATGELRGVAGDAATVALDESEAEKLVDEAGYRLVTLPAEPQADREFASLLRTADETMAAIAVEAGSALVGSTVGEVGTVVAAVRPASGAVRPIPPRSYAFEAGDLVYLVGRPDALRRFESDAASGDRSGESEPAEGDSSGEPDDTSGDGSGGSASVNRTDSEGSPPADEEETADGAQRS